MDDFFTWIDTLDEKSRKKELEVARKNINRIEKSLSDGPNKQYWVGLGKKVEKLG